MRTPVPCDIADTMGQGESGMLSGLGTSLGSKNVRGYQGMGTLCMCRLLKGPHSLSCPRGSVRKFPREKKILFLVIISRVLGSTVSARNCFKNNTIKVSGYCNL